MQICREGASDNGGRTKAGVCFAALMLFARAAAAGNFYAGTSPSNVPWTNGVVPYEFTNTLTAAMQQTYLDGLREWELAANVKFVPHTNQARWILFTYNTNYVDNVAPGYSPQVVTVDNLSRAQVGHEMGHSFGFTHENIRRDQTNYLTVLSNNVTPGNLVWFQVDPASVTNGNYDFESVMHLGRDFASVQPGVLDTQMALPAYARYQPRMGNLCLSPGDRAALRFLYGPPVVPITNIVTTTADARPGSLRAAMYYVTDHPGAVVQFAIPPSDAGYSNGVYTIHLTGHLPPLAADSLVIDGSTQPGFTDQPVIVVDGSQILPDPRNANTGLLVYSANNQVKNLSFRGFNWNGLTLLYADATNNTIAGCWLGLDATGTNAAPNDYQGIFIANGASRNIIGGGSALARNVISGNRQYGIWIAGSNTTGNLALGNLIGTDASGLLALSNGLSGVNLEDGTTANLIGGTNGPARNVISGNRQYGIRISDLNTANNVVLGNYIGTDAAGSAALGNGFGGLIVLDGPTANDIGGASTNARNVISGNVNFGVWVSSDRNTVQGNIMGLDASGTFALPNTFIGMYVLAGARSNLISGNVFSGNYAEGLRLAGAGTSANLVQGNFIGTDVTGTRAIPNAYAGLTFFAGAASNSAGGIDAATRNVISGNGSYGVVIGDPNTVGNSIQGNFIGVGADGSNALANGTGVLISNGAQTNVLGLNRDGSGAGNRIAFNGNQGVRVDGTNTFGNSFRGNSIYGNGALGIDLDGPSFYGVTPNDPGDGDVGPNNLQNYPVITNAVAVGSSTRVYGTLNSAAERTFLIDIYRNLGSDPSGYGEGQIYAGTAAATNDSGGNSVFAATVSGNFAGQYFTATATDLASGDTSEFSLALVATNGPVAPAFLAPISLTPTGFTAKLSLAIGQTYRVQATTNFGADSIPWVELTNFTADATNLIFLDRGATNLVRRFYRVISR